MVPGMDGQLSFREGDSTFLNSLFSVAINVIEHHVGGFRGLRGKLRPGHEFGGMLKNKWPVQAQKTYCQAGLS